MKLSIKSKTCLALLVSLSNLNTVAFEAYPRTDDFPLSINSGDRYFKEIQSIIDKRCVSCHACREAECRLELTSPEGLLRGGSLEQIHGYTFSSVKRTKLGHDAKTINEWRNMGFYSVIEPVKEGSLSILSAALDAGNKQQFFLKENGNLLGVENQKCGTGYDDLNQVVGMPYNMAPMDKNSEFLPFLKWSLDPFLPSSAFLAKLKQPNKPDVLKEWEDFLNLQTNKAKWTSRYLYEHTFIVRYYFEESPGEFFELVRSKTPFPQPIDVLPTLHAWEDPGEPFYYRFQKVHSTIVLKNHFVYRVNREKLNELKNMFWRVSWGEGREDIPFNFNNSNPLVAFKHIPALSRYQWMLQNAHMILDINGRSQNCRSVSAGSPYWDNFLHLFVKPESDVTVVYDKQFYDETGKYLVLPYLTGGVNRLIRNYNTFQEPYGVIKRRYQDTLKPKGFTPEDLWDGDGNDKNAVVTVLRHEWTASAHKGQWGQMPRSVFLLDYSLFERYYYLCTVITEVSDAMFTRQAAVVNYLFDLKREGEDQFLSLIPEKYRRAIKQNLVQGQDVDKAYKAPFALPYNEDTGREVSLDERDPYTSFIANLLSYRYSQDIIGNNSFVIENSSSTKSDRLHRLQNLHKLKTGFAAHLPNVAYLRILLEDGHIEYYTLTSNRYFKHRNAYYTIWYEKRTRIPEKDTLEVFADICVGFPQKIYMINEAQFETFVSDIQTISSRDEFLVFNQKYGLDQRSSSFWPIIDEIQSRFIAANPIDGGIIDLHKYGSIDNEEPL